MVDDHFHGCHLASTNSLKNYKLKRLIASLSEKNSGKKEFVSLYIPPDNDLENAIFDLKKTAETLPSKTENRNAAIRLSNVLKKSIDYIKLQKQVPSNGLAFFAGSYMSVGGNEEMVIEAVIPPEPLSAYLLVVDSRFLLEPLREMLRNQRSVGILVLDAKDASFGLLKGEQFEFVESISSGVAGKSGKGGSSQRRYERERDMSLGFFFHRIAEHAAKNFLEAHTINALVIGGPGITKENFSKSNILHYELQNSLLTLVDTQSAGCEGLKEALEKSRDERLNMCSPEEKQIMQRLLTDIAKQGGHAIYGFDTILNALRKGSAEVALVANDTGMVEVLATCKKCGQSKSELVTDRRKTLAVQQMLSQPCIKCTGLQYEIVERDIVDVLEDIASQTQARVEVISSDSKEKEQLKALGGFAALLRYQQKSIG